MYLLHDLLVLFSLSIVAVLFMHRFKLPPLVGFLLTGILCGPYGFGLINKIAEVEALADIGIILLLFSVGLEFSLGQVARFKRFFLAGGILQVLLTLGATMFLVRAVGHSWSVSIFFGMLVSLSSTAIVLRLLIQHGEIDSPHGGVSLSILIFQDLCVVLMVFLTPFLGQTTQDWPSVSWVLLKAFLFIVTAILVSRYVVPWIFDKIVKTRNREAFLLTIILLSLGAAWMTSKVGLSLALGAFIAGLMLSESEYSHQALTEILPFREVFNSLFFISVGMLFDARILITHPFYVLSGLLMVMVLKSFIVSLITFFMGCPLRTALITGLSLAQIGEFSFVLSKGGVNVGIFDNHFNQLFLAIAVISMALTPAFFSLAPQIAGWLEKTSLGKWAAQRYRATFNETEKKSLQNHVIIFGYGVNGRLLANNLKKMGIFHVIIDMNPITVKTERKKGIPIFYGDVSRSEVLQRAGIEKAKAVVIAISDAAATQRSVSLVRQLNPKVHIVVRSHYIKDTPILASLGANEVIPEEFGASIEILTDILHQYEVPIDIIENCVNEIRSQKMP